MTLRIAAMLALVLASACGAAPSRAPVAGLAVIAVPASTRVYVDDQYLASAQTLARRPARLATGRHFVTFEAPGHFPHDVEINLAAGTTVIRISLRPIPP